MDKTELVWTERISLDPTRVDADAFGFLIISRIGASTEGQGAELDVYHSFGNIRAGIEEYQREYPHIPSQQRWAELRPEPEDIGKWRKSRVHIRL